MITPRKKAIGRSLVVLGLAFARPAAAQVNVEPMRAKLEDDGLGGSVDARFAGRLGNSEGLTAGGDALIGGRSEPHFGFLALNGDYSRLNGSVQLARYFAHARYNFTLATRWWWEVFAQVEHDRFRRLTFRKLLGTGPRFALMQGEPLAAYLGTAYMLESETLDVQAGSGDDSAPLAHRSSSYLSLLAQPDDRVTLVSTTYFQPRFDEPSDYRVLSVTAAKFAISKLLTAGLTFTLRYDSEPPTGVQRTDAELNNTLGLVF
ncbi:MAG: DUF481 domain-containing protein [Myxococcales bacterium]|nr:DUF481 domain-containing protein [Myxococcales bacterium]MCB9581653.1 DUF481 domain-containing protein [Polyangiaceae bacterium]